MNNKHAQQLIRELMRRGVREVCLCPGSRNAPLLYALTNAKELKSYFWFEERAAAFFALGRIKATNHPVAVITTSGTAAAEMLPAAMEAYYLCQPLILITADRPRNYRGTNAPQSAEQLHLFGCYTPFIQDLAFPEECNLSRWCGHVPVHLNVCIEEPKDIECKEMLEDHSSPEPFTKRPLCSSAYRWEFFQRFAQSVKCPLVVVGALDRCYREDAVDFLLKLGWPVYAEGLSGIREEPRLSSLRILRSDQIWKQSEKYRYPLDGILRIGGIPTIRLWRDLEEKEGQVQVCSVSEQPFSGLSWNGVIHTSLKAFFFESLSFPSSPKQNPKEWVEANAHFQKGLLELFDEEPAAEPSLVHEISKQIASEAHVYLGNSMPIRYWDLASIRDEKSFNMAANRGLSGIDGQISTFLGFCSPVKQNWAILGDLTALYDMAAPWIISQLPDIRANIVILNNGGGQIFSRMYSHPKIINSHQISFEPLASMWGLSYLNLKKIPSHLSQSNESRIIEIIPDNEATGRFWKKMEQL